MLLPTLMNLGSAPAGSPSGVASTAMYRAIVSFFSILLLMFVLAPYAHGADIYVNCSTGNDTTGDGSTGTPYKTVGKAESVASSSDIIYGADSCDETVTIDVDNLRITQWPGATAFVMDSDDTKNTAFAVSDGTDNLEVDNMTFQDYGQSCSESGIYFINFNCTGSNCLAPHIHNNLFQRLADGCDWSDGAGPNTNAIRPRGVAGAIIENNIFDEIGGYMIRNGAGANITIRYNVFNIGSSGIKLWDTSAETIDNLKINGNKFLCDGNGDEHGAGCKAQTAIGSSDDFVGTLIYNNYFENCLNDIVLETSDSFGTYNIDGVIIENNETVKTSTVCNANTGIFVNIDDCAAFTIDNIVIRNNHGTTTESGHRAFKFTSGKDATCPYNGSVDLLGNQFSGSGFASNEVVTTSCSLTCDNGAITETLDNWSDDPRLFVSWPAELSVATYDVYISTDDISYTQYGASTTNRTRIFGIAAGTAYVQVRNNATGVVLYKTSITMPSADFYLIFPPRVPLPWIIVERTENGTYELAS